MYDFVVGLPAKINIAFTVPCCAKGLQLTEKFNQDQQLWLDLNCGPWTKKPTADLHWSVGPWIGDSSRSWGGGGWGKTMVRLLLWNFTRRQEWLTHMFYQHTCKWTAVIKDLAWSPTPFLWPTPGPDFKDTTHLYIHLQSSSDQV